MATSRQSTYLLPNAGGFDSFVNAVGGVPSSPEESEHSPERSVSVQDPLKEDGVRSEASGSSLSEFFSPVSDHVEQSIVAPLRSSSSLDGLEEPPISEEERLATVPVQGLLDRMNGASTEMMRIEQEIHQLEDKRREIANEWSDRKIKLLHEIGPHAIEKAKPIFEAYEEQLQLQNSVNEATLQYNQAVIECDEMKQALHTATDNGSTDTHLGEILALLVSCQTRRDTYEHLSLDRTNEFKNAQAKVIQLRKQVGLRAVERAWPWFEAFMQCKGLSEELTDRIHALKKEMATFREEYRDSMHELEAISAKVHAIRKRLEPEAASQNTS
jgi:hypothetical protein